MANDSPRHEKWTQRGPSSSSGAPKRRRYPPRSPGNSACSTFGFFDPPRNGTHSIFESSQVLMASRLSPRPIELRPPPMLAEAARDDRLMR